MARSYRWWLGAAYKRNPPEMLDLISDLEAEEAAEEAAQASDMAIDAVSAEDLQKVLRRLARRWEKRFDELASGLAAGFVDQSARHADASLKTILRRAGMTVKFSMTSAERDVLRATVQANVALIKSIPQHHHTEVEGAVMRAVQAGRDLASLYDDLRYRHGVTKRRAKEISLDQSNKITGALQKVRFLELHIEEATWRHSYAGREPRPQHVAMDGKRYKVAQGMWDPVEKKFVYPGELIRCRCSSSPVVPGFT